MSVSALLAILDESDSDCSDSFAPAGQPQPIGGCSRDAHWGTQRGRQDILGFSPPLAYARPVADDLHGDVYNREARATNSSRCMRHQTDTRGV